MRNSSRSRQSVSSSSTHLDSQKGIGSSLLLLASHFLHTLVIWPVVLDSLRHVDYTGTFTTTAPWTLVLRRPRFETRIICGPKSITLQTCLSPLSSQCNRFHCHGGKKSPRADHGRLLPSRLLSKKRAVASKNGHDILILDRFITQVSTHDRKNWF